jgi:hypothetical protein
MGDVPRSRLAQQVVGYSMLEETRHNISVDIACHRKIVHGCFLTYRESTGDVIAIKCM